MEYVQSLMPMKKIYFLLKLSEFTFHLDFINS